MLLTLDIGNSAVKGGLVAEGELTRVFSVAPPDPDPADQETAYWRDALTPHLSDTTITQIGLVSVVPSRTEAVTGALRPLTGAPTTFVHPDLELPFALNYETPDTLSADRLAAAAAGWVHHGRDGPQSVLVVDAGTAVNYEVVHRDGIYQGAPLGQDPPSCKRRSVGAPHSCRTCPCLFRKPPWANRRKRPSRAASCGASSKASAACTPASPSPSPTRPGWSSQVDGAASSPIHLGNGVHHAPHLVLRGAAVDGDESGALIRPLPSTSTSASLGRDGAPKPVASSPC